MRCRARRSLLRPELSPIVVRADRPDGRLWNLCRAREMVADYGWRANVNRHYPRLCELSHGDVSAKWLSVWQVQRTNISAMTNSRVSLTRACARRVSTTGIRRSVRRAAPKDRSAKATSRFIGSHRLRFRNWPLTRNHWHMCNAHSLYAMFLCASPAFRVRSVLHPPVALRKSRS